MQRKEARYHQGTRFYAATAGLGNAKRSQDWRSLECRRHRTLLKIFTLCTPIREHPLIRSCEQFLGYVAHGEPGKRYKCPMGSRATPFQYRAVSRMQRTGTPRRLTDSS